MSNPVIHIIRQSFNDLLNLFYPPLCLTCDRVLHESEQLICHQCLSDLPFTHFSFLDENPVFNKLNMVIPVRHATSLLLFHESGLVKELIHQLKYNGHQEIGKLMSDWFIYQNPQLDLSRYVDLIVPVPLHPKKRKKRGYNQMTVWGENLSRYYHLPYREDILVRTIHTTSQTNKNIEQRRENVQNAFAVSNPSDFSGKHFLILDDVMTTGATVEACAETILQSVPGAQVSVLTMAMVIS